MTPLRALSLSQPWAWTMTAPAGGLRKDVENRSKPCQANMIGKRFAIHAALSWDADGAAMIYQAGLRFPPKATISRGSIIATATIDRQVTSASELPVEQRRWFFGPFGYVFRDLTVLTKPVPCKGMLGFWSVPEDALGQITGQLVADTADHVAKAGYSDDFASLLFAAVRRTYRAGRQLDDAAWEPTPGDGRIKSRAEAARAFLGAVS